MSFTPIWRRIDSVYFWVLGPTFIFLLAIPAIFGIVSTTNKAIVSETSRRLSGEISKRVNEKIEAFVKLPPLITKLNQDAADLSEVDFSGSEIEVINFFVKRLSSIRGEDTSEDNENTSINSTYFAFKENSGNDSNKFLGAEFDPDQDKIVGVEAGEETDNKYRSYKVVEPRAELELDQNQKPTKAEGIPDNKCDFIPSKRPWFEEKKTGWSDVYTDFTTRKAVITAISPVYEGTSREFIGVLGTDLLFPEISEFMKKVLQDSELNNGFIFITSADATKVFVTSEGHEITDPAKAEEAQENCNYSTDSFTPNSPDEIAKFYGGSSPEQGEDAQAKEQLKSTSSRMQSAAEEFKKLGNQCGAKGKFKAENEQYFFETSFLGDHSQALEGLDWCVFIVIPESDLKRIAGVENPIFNLKNLLILAIFLGALGLSYLSSNKLIRPIRKLTESIDELSESVPGDGHIVALEINHPTELRRVAEHFNETQRQLNVAFSNLKENNKSLETSKEQLETSNQQLKRTKRAFEFFVPKKFLELLNISDAAQVLDVISFDEQNQILRVSGEKNIQKRMSVLFSDIRSFTALSEEELRSPADSFGFINSFLRRMEPAILQNHGFIDKYIGDEIMALFSGSSSEKNSIDAALSMLRRLRQFNEERLAYTNPRRPIHIGIGIHTGPVMLGIVGGESRVDVTVVSNHVNRASRLEGLTREFNVDLLVSEETLFNVKDSVRQTYLYRYLGSHSPKGIRDSIRIYEIFNEDDLELKQSKSLSKGKFEEAVRLYDNQQYESAKQVFSEIFENHPQDKTCEIFINKCFRG